jgi:chromosome segregation ATPase
MRTLSGDVSTIDRQYKGAKAQLEDISRRIKEAEEAAAGDHRGRRLELSSRRDQITLECNKLKQEDVDVKDRLREVEIEMRKFEDDRHLARATLGKMRDQVGALEMHIRDLRSAKTNYLNAYGPNMPKLFQLVQTERRWRGPIVGPIGSVVKIRDSQWAQVLESVIGNTLNAFCVTNVSDRQLLLQLMREANCLEIPIITGSDEHFDYSSGEPERGILTVLRVLDIEDEFVKRQLIVHLNIERAALVQARVDGDVLMRSRPRNVKHAFSKDLFRLAFEAGSSTQTLQPYRGPPRLSTNVEERLKEALDRLPQDEQKVILADREVQRLESEINQLRQENADLKRRLPDIQRRLRNKQKEMEAVDDELREDEPTNVTALQASKTEFEEECRKLLDAFKAKTEDLDSAQSILDPLTKSKTGIDRQIRDRDHDREAIRAKLTEIAQSRVQAVSDKQHYEKRLQSSNDKLRELQSLEDIAQKSAEQLTEQAEAICDRVETTKTVEECRAEVKAMNARIEQVAQRTNTDIEALTVEVNKINEAFNTARRDQKIYGKIIKYLIGALDLRIAKWHIFRGTIAKQAKVLFSHFLSTRGYEGKLSFDHKDQRLTLIVKTDVALGQRGEKNPRALSGGEKSYSTICLLLALWNAVNCPLRCLDEFDVFMDAVNRRMSMRLIMHVAEQNATTQYIFITPQSISNVPQGPHVRIHRLHDPERNQMTLT